MVGCHTGLREGNIVNLIVSQCDFHNDRININDCEMKNSEPFSIGMTSEVKATLQSVLKECKVISPYVFTMKRVGRIRSMQSPCPSGEPVSAEESMIYTFTTFATTLRLYSSINGASFIRYNIRLCIKIKGCLLAMRTFFRRIGT